MKVRVPMGIPEMPNRVPPFVDVVLDGKHSVGPELDFDWNGHSWSIQLKRREERNKLVKAELQNGKTVAFRSSGGLLYPRVCSGDSCTYQPVANADDEIQLGNIVFCEVQPGNRFYAPIVRKIEDLEGRRCFTIANYAGREIGWCYSEHIYGKLIHAEH